MEKKSNKEQETVLPKEFSNLKEKHPDALLLFREGDFYRLYKEDAVKAALILGIATADKLTSGINKKIRTVEFPRIALDTYLPKLIRAGARVAICDRLEVVEKIRKHEEPTQSNNTDMAKKKKEKAVQEEPAKTVMNAAGEKPAKEKKAETQTEAKSGQKAETKQERVPHEPQMVTSSGEKVTHAHAYQSKANPEEWYFTARMDGKPLKPQLMDAADLAACQKKEMTVPQLMERYYPTKLMPKVSEEAFKMPKSIAGPEGNISVEKFNVYKEKDEQRADYGKYKFYAQIGDSKMSAVASRQDLNAYFDRVMTPAQLVEKNFGERLHLKSAYEKYQLPEGIDPKGVRVAKDHVDNKWKVSVDMGDKGRTTRHEISFDDGYSLFKTKTATREQIAAKYLNTEITGMLAAKSVKAEKSASMKR